MFRFFIYIACIALFTASCGSAAQQQYTSHAVQKGETVYSIAKDYNISEATLYNLNPDARKGLKVNSILILPGKDITGGGINNHKQRTHEVKRQETLYGIAQRYNVSVEDIKKSNKELYSRELKSGEILIIPSKSSQNGMINPNIGGLSPGTVFYVVKPKETKFGIARKFGISIADLEDLNPNLGDELKVGAEIIVPAEAVVENGQIDNDNFEYYEVKAREGFYRIKAQFGLSEEEVIALNPFAKDGLREGMILKIPKNRVPVSKEDIFVVDLEKKIDNKRMKNVALMLPFRLMRTANDSTQTDEELLKRDPTLRIALDFYSGALMAGEFAKENGIAVTLNIYDTEKNEAKVSSIISQKEFKNVDAVIGPLLQKNVEKASALLQSENIPVFSPLSNRDMNMGDNFFQTIPTEAVLQKLMVSYLKENAAGKNIIVIADSKRQKQKEMVQNAISGTNSVSPRGGGYIQGSDVTAVANQGMENWVILLSDNPVLVSSAVNVLAAMPSSYRARLFALDRNEAYEWHEVSSRRLAKLNFTFPSVNRNSPEDVHEPFMISYKNKYGVLPNRYAIRGFDLTYDVLLRLASNKNIYDAVSPEKETVYLENKFRYERTASGTYCNQAAYILKYNDELKFDVVK